METEAEMKHLAESELRSFLGKGATDPYGRNLGRIIGVTLNSYGEMEAVEVEKGVGELDRIPAERLSLDGDRVVVIPRWKIEVESLIREIDSAQRRLSALNNLLRSREIPQSLYDELSSKQKEELDGLRARKKTAIDILKSRSKELDTQLEELTKVLVEIRAGEWSSDFSAKAYDLASGSIEPNLDFAAKEKRELADSLAKLAKIL